MYIMRVWKIIGKVWEWNKMEEFSNRSFCLKVLTWEQSSRMKIHKLYWVGVNIWEYLYGSIENFLLITWNPNTIQKIKGSSIEIVLDSSIISYWHYYHYLYVFNFKLYLGRIVIDEALTTVILCHFYKTLNQRHSYNFFFSSK